MNEIVLNRALELQTRKTVPDNAGGFVSTWETLGQVWAQIDSSLGGTQIGEGASVSRLSLSVITRAAPMNDPRRPRVGQRFLEGARVYAIEAVDDYDRFARYVKCRCKEEIAP